MDKILDSLLINMGILSNLKEGDKIYMQKNGILNKYNKRYDIFSYVSIPVNRWVYNESREETYDYINHIINLANDYIYHESYEDFHSILKERLANVMNGIKNLQKTYEDDNSTYTDKLQSLVEKVEKILEQSK